MRIAGNTKQAALVLACFLPLRLLAQAPPTQPRPNGAGGFPVSLSHASAWFGHQADATQKIVSVMFYFQGQAGWHNQRTSFRWETSQIPATMEMSIGTIKIQIKYWHDSGILEIQGVRASLSDGNVFVVEGIDAPHPTVKPLGVHDLSFTPKENPAVALLQRNPGVWSALTGRSAQEHSRAQKSGEQGKLAALDERGIQLLQPADPESDRQACELFRQAALQGYAGSQYRLGYCYEAGRGVEQSYSTANEWYEKAARQDYVDAQYKLGHSYRVGRGLPVDLAVAFQWYLRAAENGDSDAQYNIGWLYATGQGTEASPENAYHWFLQAARQGETGAQFEVARRLREADGVPKNLGDAYAWLLVLRVRERDFSPTDWEQVRSAIETVANQMGETGASDASESARQRLAVIAKHEMERLGRP